VKPEDIHVGSLGYPQAAIDSYRILCLLRDEGVVPGHLRFQVALPTVAAFLNAHLADLRPGPEILKNPNFSARIAPPGADGALAQSEKPEKT